MNTQNLYCELGKNSHLALKASVLCVIWKKKELKQEFMISQKTKNDEFSKNKDSKIFRSQQKSML